MGYVVDVVRATRSVAVAGSGGLAARGDRAAGRPAGPGPGCPGADYVTPDDVKALARPTLRHRVQLRPEAELEGVTRGRRARHRAVAAVPVPR